MNPSILLILTGGWPELGLGVALRRGISTQTVTITLKQTVTITLNMNGSSLKAGIIGLADQTANGHITVNAGSAGSVTVPVTLSIQQIWNLVPYEDLVRFCIEVHLLYYLFR